MPLTRRAVLSAGLAASIASFQPPPAQAAPRARLISARWRTTGSRRGPDHIRWTTWLKRYRRMGSDGVARVAYGEVEQAGRDGLALYLSRLQREAPTLMTRDAALAYWINLYNAQTVALVLDAWPVGSIREVRGGLFNLGPWDEKVLKVERKELSLDDIEHGILRPIWKDPRLHYALNCAALGCPNLGEAAYQAETVDATLDAAAHAFMNHPRGVRFEGDDLIVSSIYSWFEEDFGGSESGVLNHMRAHAEPALRERLAGRTEYDDHSYDWAINAA